MAFSRLGATAAVGVDCLCGRDQLCAGATRSNILAARVGAGAEEPGGGGASERDDLEVGCNVAEVADVEGVNLLTTGEAGGLSVKCIVDRSASNAL